MQVQASWQDLPTATGVMRTLVLTPQGKPSQQFGAVLFYSEIFQITAPIRRTATMLAGMGFIVLVPEIFHELNPIGTVLAYDDAGKDKGNQDKWHKALTSYDTDNDAMYAYLQSRADFNGKVGAVGVCIGGHLAFRAALKPYVRSTVCLYATDLHSNTLPDGGGAQTLAQASAIQGELTLIWGRQDPHVNEPGRRVVQAALEQAGVYYQWHEVNAPHAFMRDEGERYDAALSLWVYNMCQLQFLRDLA